MRGVTSLSGANRFWISLTAGIGVGLARGVEFVAQALGDGLGFVGLGIGRGQSGCSRESAIVFSMRISCSIKRLLLRGAMLQA